MEAVSCDDFDFTSTLDDYDDVDLRNNVKCCV